MPRDPGFEPTELGSLLGLALHARLDGTAVDEGSLLEGARQGAKTRRRRRRAALVVAAAAVLLVPAGVIAAQGMQRDVGSVTADAGDVLLREGDHQPQPGGTQSDEPQATASDDPLRPGSEPSSAASGATGPTGGAGAEEPTTPTGQDGSLLTAGPGSIPAPLVEPEDLPVPMELEFSMTTAKIPSLPGQVCNENRPGLAPFDGQTESWAEEGDSPDQQSVSVSVTRWAPGESALAFDEVQQDTGRCRFQDEGEVVTWHPSHGQEGLQRSREYQGLDFSASLLRTGDLLVGVELVGPDGTEDLQEGSADVAEAVALRLDEAGAVGPER